jgi:tetratricopeptide (TPR) repeat protein
MSQFLFSAKNPENREVTERIDAVNVSAARYALETRGYQSIVFHTDDMTAAIDKSLGIDKSKRTADWTASHELRARLGRSNWSRLFIHLPKLAPIWAPLLIWTVYAGVHYQQWWELVSAVVFNLWFIRFYLLLILPGIAYQSLLRAVVWCRWNKVRLWVRVIRWLNHRGKSSIPEFELHLRLAAAMAATGKISEALRLVAKFEQDPKITRGSYLSRISSLYAYAKDFDAMTRCQKEVVEQGTGSASELIDYACGLVQRHKKIAEARAALAQAKEKEITSLAARYVVYCEGMIAVEEKQYGEAVELLQKALEMGRSNMEQPLVQSWVVTVKSYLCVAAGNIGQKDKARALLKEVTPLLTVRREAEMLQRCAAACQ